MSVDFYQCECCGESRYEEYVGYCSKGEHRICTFCLENDDINSNYAHHYNVKFDGSSEMKEEYGIETKEEDPEYGYEIGDIIDDSGIDSKYCPFCNKTEVSDGDLLSFLLKKLNLTLDEAKQEFIKFK